MDKLTPWQEINPATALAGQGERRWLSSNAYVLRASTEEIVGALTQSLAMVAPVGMTQEDREQWLGAAALAIRDADIPPREFAWAAGKARIDPECDHPAKIVPAIMRLIGEFKPEIHTVKSQEKYEPDPDKLAYYEAMGRIANASITQAEIDALPAETKVSAHTRCLLNTDYEGRYWLPGKRPVTA